MSKPIRIRAKALGPPSEICLFGGIGDDGMGEGITAKSFDAEFKALGSPGEILLRINSPGGDVFEAMAIYTILNVSRATVTARIEGLAASAASLIAMAADRIEIAENAFMLIHEPYTSWAGGTADDLETASEDLRRMTDQYVGIYSRRSGRDSDEILSLMKEDRLMTADEAVELGLCDEVIDPSSEKVNLKLVPESFRAAVRAAIMEKREMATTSRKSKAETAIAELRADFDELKKLIVGNMKSKAKAEDEEDDGYAEDGDENDEKPTNAKGKKAKAESGDDDGDEDDKSDARADDDTDMDASSDDDGEDADEDSDAPKSRKAKAKSGLSYASSVADICTLAKRTDLIAGFLSKRTPLADIRKRLMKARADDEDTISNVRRNKEAGKSERIDASWDAAIKKVHGNRGMK
ncbi:ATP-dependent Clp protease proteolytic subunit [Labrys miyagiensis]